jgi:hypothetical protein
MTMVATNTGGGVDPLAQTRTELREVRRAWGVLAMGSEASARSLVALAVGARSEMVRAQAAGAVLDRVGLGPIQTHIVSTDLDSARMADMDAGSVAGGTTPAEILAARMRALGGPVIVVQEPEPDTA